MQVCIYWNGGDISHHLCDSVVYRPDIGFVVLFISNDNRSFHLEDIKKIVVKEDEK